MAPQQVFISISVAVLCVLSAHQSAFAASETAYLDKGIEHFKAGDFEGAAQFFYTVTVNEPRNIEARYLLGNSFLKLGRMPEAAAQYRAVIQLEPKGQFAEYSRRSLPACSTGVDKTEAWTAGAGQMGAGQTSAGQTSVGQASVGRGGAKAEPLVRFANEAKSMKAQTADPAELAEEKELKRAAKTFDAQAQENEKNIAAEADAAVKRIMKEAADKISALETEKQSVIGASTSGSRRYNTYNREEITKSVEQDYQSRIDLVRQDAKKRSDDVMAESKAKIEALENTIVNSNHAMLEKRRPGEAHPVPLATDMHVHNYEIEDEPSGSQLPLIAPPSQPLKPVNAKGKPSR